MAARRRALRPGLIGVAAALALVAPLLVQIVLGGGVYARATSLFAPIAFAYWLKAMRQASGATLIADGRSWAYSTSARRPSRAASCWRGY